MEHQAPDPTEALKDPKFSPQGKRAIRMALTLKKHIESGPWGINGYEDDFIQIALEEIHNAIHKLFTQNTIESLTK